MPVRPLPATPSLAHLKHQAKDLLRLRSGREAFAAQKIREFHPNFINASDAHIFSVPFTLADAQLTIAREHGSASWASIKSRIERPTPFGRLDMPHHERIADPVFRRAVDLLDSGSVSELDAWLNSHPGLVLQQVAFEGGNYFRSPSLLEFVAENPVRHGVLPANIVQVARVILDAGPTPAARQQALFLVATGRITRQCNVQRPLIDLLCQYGANPNGAVRSAAMHGEVDGVLALLENGAVLDLPVAAALGRLDDCVRLLPAANPDERHFALAAAAQFGFAAIVRLLLEAGEDPSRYNPQGGHSHATPLHQAAAAGHLDVVRLLVAAGAPLDRRDVLWNATAAAWAAHEGKTDVEAFLRNLEMKDG